MRATGTSLVLTALLLLGVTRAAKILILHPMHAASHILTLRQLAGALSQQGHQIEIIRWKDEHHYPPISNPNITEHELAMNNTDGSIPHLSVEERASFQLPQDLLWSKGTSWTAIPWNAFFTVGVFCSTLFEQEQLIYHLRRQQFDIAVVDILYNECSLALAHHLNLPSIGYWAFTFAGGEPQYTTAFSPPSSVPFILSHYGDSMSFFQRVLNHLLALGSHLVMQVQFAVTNSKIQTYLPGTPHPSALLANLSGVLINSHPSLDYPRLLPPSFINVGGMQIRPPKPLPSDLENFVNGSGDAGIILFTMGISFNSKVVPSSLIDAFMRAFGRLEQRVLMKLEEEYPHPPSNVKLVKWLPQQDVLAHPKTRLFFTHCGMHGVIEALHYGVPMVGMPVFADQEDVLVRIQQKGVGTGVPKNADEETIYRAVAEVLQNPRYKRNALRLSSILRDNPEDPLNQALWLVNHVINTKGAEHLKFSARNLGFIQFFGLDVFMFWLLSIYALLFYVFPVTKRLAWSLVLSRQKMKIQ
ncbi:UDP-glucuronosyltransferase 1A10-like [Macrobrachium rosenbergii]|uniref:UDP-glucuronosyltransferase 1A10-like n=1 Tax=Macrobrachium rosenbergii TaxID=79674 RepID=UPI0034D3CABC